MNILGISAFYHDSAAALIRDGEIVAAAQEERFSRVKHDAGFPVSAIRYCLAEGGIKGPGLDTVIFYDKPMLKLSRLLETFFSAAPRGLKVFVEAIPVWMREKIWTAYHVERSLSACGVDMPAGLLYAGHHESHAASAFYPSPFHRSAILTMDGVGEWVTAAIGRGEGGVIEMIQEQRFPHSLGLLYSAFTYFCGFKVNDGEYKLMGLAPYGRPAYVSMILERLIDLKDDGSFRMNMEYFGYLDSAFMTGVKFAGLFGGPPRRPGSEITRREMDLARSIQEVTSEIVLRMGRHAFKVTGEERLCLAGGVALNCVANGRLLREGPFRDIWIQPAAGDAGGAVGAALIAWNRLGGASRNPGGAGDGMGGAFLGPAFGDGEMEALLKSRGYPVRRLGGTERAPMIAGRIAEGRVVGYFDGRMEFGPRALGARSILADPRSASMRGLLNRKIKERESFRPFALSCLEERVGECVELDRPSPYMLIVAPVPAKRRRESRADDGASLAVLSDLVLSDLPAVTHVDYSTRVQTVSRNTNPRFYEVIKAFAGLTGCPAVLNTSFNGADEPIVMSPRDALDCFLRTGMDDLVLGDCLISKEDLAEADRASRREAPA